jgi:uncharacterized protein (DUF488 family)
MTTIVTIGHGNRSIEEFIGLLKDAGIECLVDVRAYPASRRHPQFARAALEQSLSEAGIRYMWEGKALGGRRKLAKDSPHAALKSPGFRAYADHMMTAEFRAGAQRLIERGRTARAAMMCAERQPSECHRSLISDYLVARGEQVSHLLEAGATESHCLNPLARLRNGELIYDGETQGELKL